VIPIVIDDPHEGFYNAFLVVGINDVDSDFDHHSSEGEGWVKRVIWKGFLI